MPAYHNIGYKYCTYIYIYGWIYTYVDGLQNLYIEMRPQKLKNN